MLEVTVLGLDPEVIRWVVAVAIVAAVMATGSLLGVWVGRGGQSR